MYFKQFIYMNKCITVRTGLLKLRLPLPRLILLLALLSHCLQSPHLLKTANNLHFFNPFFSIRTFYIIQCLSFTNCLSSFKEMSSSTVASMLLGKRVLEHCTQTNYISFTENVDIFLCIGYNATIKNLKCYYSILASISTLP